VRSGFVEGTNVRKRRGIVKSNAFEGVPWGANWEKFKVQARPTKEKGVPKNKGGKRRNKTGRDERNFDQEEFGVSHQAPAFGT